VTATIEVRPSPPDASCSETRTPDRRNAAVPPAPTTEFAADRRRRAHVLVALAGGRRERLEDLRAGYLNRLHRASNDFAATDGLRVVEAALALVPRAELPDSARTRRRPTRRWWRSGRTRR
jgi:hypothetical protein